MKNTVWIALSVLGIASASAAAWKYRSGKAVPEPSAPLVEAPVAAASPEPESTLHAPPTRPAVAAEIVNCEKEAGTLPSDWHIERSWKIAHSADMNQDICLAEQKIRLKNGKVANIDDSQVSDEYAALDRNSVVAYFQKEGYFAVSNSFMENSSLYLINDTTGERTDLLVSAPLFSPEGHWFVSISTSGNGESTPNQIGIWSVSDKGLQQVYDSGATERSPENLKWVDDKTITFDMEKFVVDDKNNKSIPSQLQYDGKTWTLSPPAAPAKDRPQEG